MHTTGSHHVEAVGSELSVVANGTIFLNIVPCRPAAPNFLKEHMPLSGPRVSQAVTQVGAASNKLGLLFISDDRGCVPPKR